MPKGDNTTPREFAKVHRRLDQHEKRLEDVEVEQLATVRDIQKLTDMSVALERRELRLRRVVAKHGARISKLERR